MTDSDNVINLRIIMIFLKLAMKLRSVFLRIPMLIQIQWSEIKPLSREFIILFVLQFSACVISNAQKLKSGKHFFVQEILLLRLTLISSWVTVDQHSNNPANVQGNSGRRHRWPRDNRRLSICENDTEN